jgi:hypothetical protein
MLALRATGPRPQAATAARQASGPGTGAYAVKLAGRAGPAAERVIRPPAGQAELAERRSGPRRASRARSRASRPERAGLKGGPGASGLTKARG